MITHDRINRRSLVGLLSAIAGGIVVVVLPLLLGSDFGNFGWLPIAMMAVFIIIDAIFPVYLRKFNEKGVPVFTLLFFSFTIASIVSALLAVIFHGPDTFTRTLAIATPWHWALMLFLGLFVSVIHRAFSTKAYENIGTASVAVISYLYYFLAVFLPVVLLHEIVSWEMLLGVALIILGIFLTSHKQHRHFPLHHHR
jgi:drug/metabolite transporter (DMT)-like permease